MFRIRSAFLLAFCTIVMIWCSFAQNLAQGGVATSSQKISNRSGSAGEPLAFETNRGQAAGCVDFVARGHGYSAQLRADGVTLGLRGPLRNTEGGTETAGGDVVEITLTGANQRARATGEDKLPGHSNYLSGSNPAGWITDVEQYAKVRYAEVYPGIDMVFHGNQSRLEHDFVLRAGATAAQIGLSFSGVWRTELRSDGDLVLQVGSGEIRLQRPRAYQVAGNREVEVPVRYVLHEGHARFRLGRYDPGRTLIIDPVLIYSTFFGGAAGSNGVQQEITAIAVDGAGNLYAAGKTDSTSFPVTTGVVQPSPAATFISKLDPTGTALIFSTYMQGFVSVSGLAVDTQGDVFVAGEGASGLPIPSGSNPFQAALKSIAVLKLNPTGTAVLNASYLGGSGTDSFGGLALDSAGEVFLTGTTPSNDFPLQNPLQSTLGTSGSSGFVTELNPTLSALIYSTYLGGNSDVNLQGPEGLALDASGDAYVVGTASPGLPTTAGAYQMTCPDDCVFLAELNPAGSALLRASYVGSGGGVASAVVVDSLENAYVAGVTFSASFPVLNAIQPCSTINGTTAPSGNFLAEFGQTGALTLSTCLGIPGLDDLPGYPTITLDGLGNAYVAGNAQAGLPLQSPIDANPPLEQGGNPGGRPFVGEIDHATHALLFSSFVGELISYAGYGSAGDLISGIAVDSNSNIYMAGELEGIFPGSLFPVLNALQPYFPVANECTGPNFDCFLIDGFVIKISPASGAAAAVSPGGLYVLGPAQSLVEPVGSTSSAGVVTVYDLGTDALTVSNVAITGDFAIQSNNCGMVSQAGGSCAIGVTFTPTQVGTRNGTLAITDDSAGSPHTVQLTGMGGQPSVVPSPTALSFSSQSIGTSSPAQTVTLTNAGALSAQITQIQVSGDFAETNTCPLTLNPTATCTIQVTFTPSSTGTRSGTLTITDNAPGSPQTVSLTGTGASPGLGLGIASGGSSSATVAAGAAAKYSLSIGGTGIGGTASLTCTGAPTGAACTVPAAEAFSATTATDFTVSVTTTLRTTGALQGGDLERLPWLWAFALMAWVVLPAGGGQAKRALRRHLRWLSLSFLVLLCSCGGSNSGVGNNPGGTPAGTYTVTVTAKVGSTSEQMPLTLIVQ